MSYKAKLEINGTEMDVLFCTFKLSRDTDHKGRPSSRVYGGRVTFEVESTSNTSLIEQMLNNQYKPFNGKLTYMKPDSEANMKELEFIEAFIVYYEETIDASGVVPMNIRFTISAKELHMGSAAQINEWPKA